MLFCDRCIDESYNIAIKAPVWECEGSDEDSKAFDGNYMQQTHWGWKNSINQIFDEQN